MSSNSHFFKATARDILDILEQFSSVSDAVYFAQGVQNNPQIIFDAIQELSMRNNYLLATGARLEEANEKIKQLKRKASQAKSSSTLEVSIFAQLVDALKSQQNIATLPKSTKIPDPTLYTDDRKDSIKWKQEILLKIKANSDHFPTPKSEMAYVYSRLNPEFQSYLHG